MYAQPRKAAMTKMGKIIQGIVGSYIGIGVILFLVQTFSGKSCDSLLGEKHVARRENLILAVALWLPDFLRHVGSGNTPLGEYLAPTRCTSS